MSKIRNFISISISFCKKNMYKGRVNTSTILVILVQRLVFAIVVIRGARVNIVVIRGARVI